MSEATTNDVEAKTAEAAPVEEPKKERVTVGCYIALFFAILYFSGVFYQIADPQWKWLGAFDFTTLLGKFGTIADGTNYIGKGGISARQGFMFSVSLFPGVMLALGIIEVLSYYGALKAAQQLLTPLLRPILGIPGCTGLALVTDLQSTDAGAAISKNLYDVGMMTKKELVIMAGWQYAGAGGISNYYSTVSALFASFLVPVWIPVVVILCFKFVGGIFVRICLNILYRKDFQ